MGRSRDANRSWWHRILTSTSTEGRRTVRRRLRGRNRHESQPAYWQGLAALEPRLMMSVTAAIIDPPAPLVIDEGGSVTFAGETTGAPATPTWDILAAHAPTTTTERLVRIDGNRVVWSTGISSTANEAVWLRDGDNAPINLSGHLNVGATEPVIWENYVAFSTSGAIYLYDINDPVDPANPAVPKLKLVTTGSHITNLEIDDGRLVFQHGTSNGFIQMYTIATAQLTTISDPGLPVEEHPDISAGQVVWRGFSSATGTHDIFLYDIATAQTTNLSLLVAGGDDSALAPQIAAGRAIWGSNLGAIYYYDGTAAQKISTAGTTHTQPVISGDVAAWWSTNGTIWSLDVTQPLSPTNQPVQLVTGLSSIQDPQVDGRNIVWSASDGGQRDVFLYDGDAAIPGPVKISTQPNSGSATDAFPVISGRNVVWVGGDVYVARAVGTTITWTIDGQLFAADTLAPSLTFADDGVHTITLTVSDGVTTATDSISVTVNNVAPVIDSLNVPPQAVRGHNVTVSAAFSDLGSLDTHTTAWQVLDSASALVASGSGTSFTFVATNLGSYTVQFTVTDDDGGTDTHSAPLDIVVAALAADPLNTGHALLTIGGSAGNDHLHVRHRNGLFEVFAGSQFHGSFALTDGDRIQVLAGDGHDWVRIDSPASIAAEVSGGAGADWIRTGEGDDILLGGDGDDLLFGNGGRDLLIGESGNDLILGNGEDDVLIGGHYTQAGDRTALLAISAAWSSPLAYAERVGILTTGVDAYGAAGGAYLLDFNTLLDDGLTDILLGLQGADYFAGVSDNDLTDSRTYEMLTETQHTFVTAI